MKRAEILLAAVLVATVVLHFVVVPDPEQRGYRFLPDMEDSPAAETFAANPALPMGRTLQPPPENTIARGFLPAHGAGRVLDTATEWTKLGPEEQAAWDAYGPEGDAQDGEPSDEARVARGRQVYAAFCRTCHGAGGEGDGPVTKRGVPPPPSLLAEGARTMSDGRMFRVISHGRGNMAAYGRIVTKEDRWNAVRYIRSLQGR